MPRYMPRLVNTWHILGQDLFVQPKHAKKQCIILCHRKWDSCRDIQFELCSNVLSWSTNEQDIYTIAKKKVYPIVLLTMVLCHSPINMYSHTLRLEVNVVLSFCSTNLKSATKFHKLLAQLLSLPRILYLLEVFCLDVQSKFGIM